MLHLTTVKKTTLACMCKCSRTGRSQNTKQGFASPKQIKLAIMILRAALGSGSEIRVNKKAACGRVGVAEKRGRRRHVARCERDIDRVFARQRERRRLEHAVQLAKGDRGACPKKGHPTLDNKRVTELRTGSTDGSHKQHEGPSVPPAVQCHQYTQDRLSNIFVALIIAAALGTMVNEGKRTPARKMAPMKVP